MELPRLEPLWKKFKDKGISVIAVDTRGDQERSKKFIAGQELTYHLPYVPGDKSDVVRTLYHVQAVPTLFLLDADGRILTYRLGFQPGDEKRLEEQIESLLKTP